MKKNYFKSLLFVAFVSASLFEAKAQTSEEVLNLMINKGVISQSDADSLRAEAAIKAQETPKDKTLALDLEWRPRVEYRQGYGQLSNDTTTPAFFITQRTRLSLNYQVEGKINFQFSMQDIREWGALDPRSTVGTVQVFEAYLEPIITKNFSIRIGRQRVMYDNQRLFAQNDWRQNGNAFDGVDLRWTAPKLSTDLFTAWNQTGQGTANNWYFPVNSSGQPIVNFKLLVVNYLKWKINDNFALTTINCMDGFQGSTIYTDLYVRGTTGGRLEYFNKAFYATVSGYYQFGKTQVNTPEISAFYIQPEVKYIFKEKTTVRLGAEVMSGQDATGSSTKANSFVPLYGVAHRFNGYMDLYTQFPSDLNNAGLVNPYLFVIQTLTKKTSAGVYLHHFASENNFVNAQKETISKNLGSEVDFVFNFTPNAATNIEIGYSVYMATASTATIKKASVGSNEHFQQWAYVMFTYKPQLFKTKFSK